jgi:hypothetical protein
MVTFICTNCTRPTQSFYKVYSTPGSIQLTTCQSCHHDVDPYVEREWLLVIMDFILHRPEAFRHVLYNRDPFCHFGSDEMASSSSTLVKFATATYLIRTCLWCAVVGEMKEDQSQIGTYKYDVFQMVLQLFVGDVVLITSTMLAGMLIVCKCYKNRGLETPPSTESKKSKMFDPFFISKIYIALTIPNLFHAVTLAVFIWENSTTICMLGTLFVLSLQREGVAIVMESRQNYSGAQDHTEKTRQRQNHSVSSYIPQSLPFFIGLVLFLAVQQIGFRLFIQQKLGIGIPMPTMTELMS